MIRCRPFIVLVFAVLYWWMAISAVRNKSATFDEPVHLTGGYSYWLRNDVRLLTDNGQLPQRMAAFPLKFMHPEFPPETDPAWLSSDVGLLASEFLYHSGNDPERMLMAGRMMIALLGAALVLLVYEWSRSLFGRVGGLISAGLCAFSPAMLAHGALVTSDMAAAFFFTYSTWAFWRVLLRISPGRLAVCAVALSGLALSKMSAVIFGPIALGLVCIRLCDPAPLPVQIGVQRFLPKKWTQFLAFAGVGVALLLMVTAAIWACCGFRFAMINPSLPGKAYDWSEFAGMNGFMIRAVDFMRAHRLLPEPYLQGFISVLHLAGGRCSFLNGRYASMGFPGFFPYVFLVKTPIALFLLLGAAVIAMHRQTVETNWLRRLVPLLWFSGVYWAFALTSHLNIGHRHILPVYPVLYILSGAVSFFLVRGSLRSRWFTCGLLLWFAGESLWIRPHYLAYFNELTGGPRNGYLHLVDSSLDWGQDLPGLKKWIDDHRLNNKEDLHVAYFGTADPASYGFHATLLPYKNNDDIGGLKPYTAGVYCISATKLQIVYSAAMGNWCVPYEKFYRQLMPEMQHLDGVSPAQLPPQQRREKGMRIGFFEELRFARLCAYLRQREPEAEIGYSILVYHLTEAEVNEALFGKPAELYPEITVKKD